MKDIHVKLDVSSPLVCVAVHNGHVLRPEVEQAMRLDENTRRHEEDPYTGLLIEGMPSRVVVDRSRFEVDLNRPRHEAIYEKPEDAWDLQIWDGTMPEDLRSGSLEFYDGFYRILEDTLDQVVARHGGFVLFDVHSYNHRKMDDGSLDRDNPEVNLGTGSLPPKWKPVAEAFLESMQLHDLDARENVRFRGRQVAAWTHEKYGDVGCALAIEFRKSFMDPQSGEPEPLRFDRLKTALQDSVDSVLSEWGQICQ